MYMYLVLLVFMNFIVNICGCDDVEQARLKFLELRTSGQVPKEPCQRDIPSTGVTGQSSEDVLTQGIQWENFQVQGDSRDTPVANFLNLRKISCLLPGEIGKEIRARMANVAVRADVGDEDLENAIDVMT